MQVSQDRTSGIGHKVRQRISPSSHKSQGRRAQSASPAVFRTPPAKSADPHSHGKDAELLAAIAAATQQSTRGNSAMHWDAQYRFAQLAVPGEAIRPAVPHIEKHHAHRDGHRQPQACVNPVLLLPRALEDAAKARGAAIARPAIEELRDALHDGSAASTHSTSGNGNGS